MIFNHLLEFPDRIALFEDGKEITYSEMINAADTLVENIPSRSVVLMRFENNYKSILAYVGFLRKKIVTLIVNPQLDREHIEDICSRFQPNYIFSLKEQFGDELVQSSEGSIYKTSHAAIPPTDDDLAILLTTSGSTGSPKFVRLSYKNLLANTKSICEYLGINKEERGITCLPLYYSFGLSLLNTHLYAGASLVVTDQSYMSPLFWNQFIQQRVTTFSGVPYTFSILRRLGLENVNLSNVHYVTQAGGKLGKEDVEYWIDFFSQRGISFVVMYGQTEATARMSYLPPAHARANSASIGIAIPGGEFYLCDGEKKILNSFEEGELVYRGDNVSLGYAESVSDLCNGDDNKGELFTGDIAYCDDKGYYFIVGRKKRFLKLFGNRTNLDEIERMLKNNGIENLCSGKDDNLRIYILNNSLKEKVNELIRTKTLINPTAYTIVVLDKFPISDSGKVLYSNLPY